MFRTKASSIDSCSPKSLAFLAQAAQAYAGLMRFAPPAEPTLGGKLLYAGELDQAGRALAVAGNIAGAATLAASAHAATLRQAMHSGVVDFLVNSLDEALRILKNEIRKHEPVSVAISVAPEIIVEEMLERGVLPDLLPPQTLAGQTDMAAFIAQGARCIAAPPAGPEQRLFVWQIPAEFAQSPASFDALLLKHLPTGDRVAIRWLRQSPRYLGPQFRRLRSLVCDEETASRLIDLLGSPLRS